MFAYCLNNPVAYGDPTGMIVKTVICNDGGGGISSVEREEVMYGESIVTLFCEGVDNFIEDIKEDYNNYDRNNQSEEKVLQSNYFSSYKGVPVIRTNGERSGSFGAIFLTRETNNRTNPEDVVRHEYGHTIQLKQLGVVDYALCIGLPSWQQWGTGEYYSKPWEITADIYGDVQSRTHSQSNIDRGFIYLAASKIIGPFVWLSIE